MKEEKKEGQEGKRPVKKQDWKEIKDMEEAT